MTREWCRGGTEARPCGRQAWWVRRDAGRLTPLCDACADARSVPIEERHHEEMTVQEVMES